MVGTKDLKTFLEKAVQSYQKFASFPPSMESKEFNAYHSACKSALMHIALLEKLIETKPEQKNTQLNLIDWINSARQELKDENDLP